MQSIFMHNVTMLQLRNVLRLIRFYIASVSAPSYRIALTPNYLIFQSFFLLPIYIFLHCLSLQFNQLTLFDLVLPI